MKSSLRNIALLGTGFALGTLYKFYPQAKRMKENELGIKEDSNSHNYHNHLSDHGNLEPFSLIKHAYNGMKASGLGNFFIHIQDRLEGFKYLEYFAPSESISYIISKKDYHEVERKEICKLGCVFEITDNLQGHQGFAHGGLICTLFDTNLSHVSTMSTQLKPAMTAYLNVSYKKPLIVNRKYFMITELDRIEDRKVFVKGRILNESGEIVSEAESLFIVLKQPMAISPFLSTIRSVASLKDSVDHFVETEAEPLE